jgi:hypothetical protein
MQRIFYSLRIGLMALACPFVPKERNQSKSCPPGVISILTQLPWFANPQRRSLLDIPLRGKFY